MSKNKSFHWTGVSTSDVPSTRRIPLVWGPHGLSQGLTEADYMYGETRWCQGSRPNRGGTLTSGVRWSESLIRGPSKSSHLQLVYYLSSFLSHSIPPVYLSVTVGPFFLHSVPSPLDVPFLLISDCSEENPTSTVNHQESPCHGRWTSFRVCQSPVSLFTESHL